MTEEGSRPKVCKGEAADQDGLQGGSRACSPLLLQDKGSACNTLGTS